MVTYTSQIPDSGETVIGKSFSTNFGGKGANQAAMASRFNATVYMVTGVGSDIFGDQIIEMLKDADFDISTLVFAENEPFWTFAVQKNS